MTLSPQLINFATKENSYLKNLQGLQIHMPRKHSDWGATIWYIIMFKYFLSHRTKTNLCHRGVSILKPELECSVII